MEEIVVGFYVLIAVGAIQPVAIVAAGLWNRFAQ